MWSIGRAADQLSLGSAALFIEDQNSLDNLVLLFLFSFSSLVRWISKVV